MVSRDTCAPCPPFRQVWVAENNDLPLAPKVVQAIEAHAPRVPLYSEFAALDISAAVLAASFGEQRLDRQMPKLIGIWRSTFLCARK